jgi:effector-binding domain-containing protein
MVKVITTFTFSYKEFSESAYEEFKKAFEEIGYYLGDICEDYYGENASDTYVLYLAKRKLTKKQLKENFAFLNDDEAA